MSKIYHGSQAISKAIQAEGPLSHPQKEVVRWEGYSEDIYLDHKGIKTRGVGQTGQFLDGTFKEAFKVLEEECVKLIPLYYLLQPTIQAALMVAMYRGDLQQSPTFRLLFNTGQLEKACEEYLNHKEYLDPDTPTQIKRRLEKLPETIKVALAYEKKLGS